jgi:hypothetical protein
VRDPLVLALNPADHQLLEHLPAGAFLGAFTFDFSTPLGDTLRGKMYAIKVPRRIR